VLTFVLVLHEAARRASTSPARIGTVEDWKQRHEELCAAEQAARQPAGVGGGHPGILGFGEADSVPLLAAAPHCRLDDAEEDVRLGEVLGLVRRTAERHWWHEYRDLVPDQLGFYLHLESIAQLIRMYKTQALPGLLQVEAYAHALLRRVNPGASEAEIARCVELRMHRQQVLGSRGRCRLWAVVEEAALRNQHLGAPAMRAQIRHLIEVAEQPNITLQILRNERGENATIKEPLTVFRFAEPHIRDVAVQGPRQPDGLVLHERKDVEHYNIFLSCLGIKACPPRETADVLRRILAYT
jgi:hypothetical protein